MPYYINKHSHIGVNIAEKIIESLNRGDKEQNENEITSCTEIEYDDRIKMTYGSAEILCKLVTWKATPKNQHEIVIDTVSESGAFSEYDDIISGMYNALFFGYVSDSWRGKLINRWIYIDLSALRYNIKHNWDVLGKSYMNYAGKNDHTKFIVFDARTFPSEPKTIIASSHEIVPKDQKRVKKLNSLFGE